MGTVYPDSRDIASEITKFYNKTYFSHKKQVCYGDKLNKSAYSRKTQQINWNSARKLKLVIDYAPNVD